MIPLTPKGNLMQVPLFCRNHKNKSELYANIEQVNTNLDLQHN